MISEIIQLILDFLGVSGGQIGLALPLIAIALYWRKALYGAGVAKGAVSKIVFACVVVGVLVLAGVLNVDVSAAIGLGQTLIDLGMDAYRVLA